MNKFLVSLLVTGFICVALIGYAVFPRGSDSDSGSTAQSSGQAGNTGTPSGNSQQGAAGRGQGGGQGGDGGRPAALVVATQVTEVLINDRLSAIGNGKAQASASVVPLSGGILTEVLVSSGQSVEANTVLAGSTIRKNKLHETEPLARP